MCLCVFVGFAKMFKRNFLDNAHECFIVCVGLHTVLLNFDKTHVVPERMLNVSHEIVCE